MTKNGRPGLCVALALLVVPACNDPPGEPPLPDLASSVDLALKPTDLATPDLATPDLTTAPKACSRQAPGMELKYVANDVLLPTGAMNYGADIDGNGKVDNQFARLAGVFGAQFDLQTPLSAAVRSGELLLGFAVRAMTLSHACAAVDAAPLARPARPPRFDGTDQLSRAPGAPAALYGAIGDPLPDAPTGNPPGQLSTVAPPRLSAAEAQALVVNLPLGVGSIPLAIQGVHVQARIDDKGLASGQLHGAIAKADVDGKVVPAIAALLTVTINQDPNSSSSKTIISLFEDRNNPVSQQKCLVPADCCAISPATCKILPAEVSSNSLIAGLLAPDVQVFDAAGRWAPVPGGASKNGLSVGIGFTGVRASF